MEAVYLVALIVGGFFVLLSAVGGLGGDVDADIDADFEVDADFDADVDVDGGSDISGVDAVGSIAHLLSLRTLFLFAAFFGLTGVSLDWAGTPEPMRLIIAVAVGLLVGFVGSWAIKQFGYKSVSSDITSSDIVGTTAKVTIPFANQDKGKITLMLGGAQTQMLAQGLEEALDFGVGDEVVVVEVNGAVARVVKPD